MAHLLASLRRSSKGRVPFVSEQPEREQRVTPLELLFDLVFVFGFTQVTTVLLRRSDVERDWARAIDHRRALVGVVVLSHG